MTSEEPKAARHLPSTRYHRTKAPRIVHTEEQHQALASRGWEESPAAFLPEIDDDVMIDDDPGTPAEPETKVATTAAARTSSRKK